jgi:hypothetical protein
MTSLDSYITLGRSGLRVSPLSLGTMTFGEDDGWGASPETAEAILEYHNRGGNVVDTANTYTYTNGHSEKIVGDFFAARPGLRERVVTARSSSPTSTPATPTAAALAARHSSPSSRSQCGVCRPTTSTCTGCTAGQPHPDRGDPASVRRPGRRRQGPLRRLLQRALAAPAGARLSPRLGAQAYGSNRDGSGYRADAGPSAGGAPRPVVRNGDDRHHRCRGVRPAQTRRGL